MHAEELCRALVSFGTPVLPFIVLCWPDIWVIKKKPPKFPCPFPMFCTKSAILQLSLCPALRSEWFDVDRGRLSHYLNNKKTGVLVKSLEATSTKTSPSHCGHMNVLRQNLNVFEPCTSWCVRSRVNDIFSFVLPRA